MATHTHPGPWWDEEPEMVVTVVAVLEAKADRIKKGRG